MTIYLDPPARALAGTPLCGLHAIIGTPGGQDAPRIPSLRWPSRLRLRPAPRWFVLDSNGSPRGAYSSLLRR